MLEVVPVDIKIYAKNLEMNSQARSYIQKKFQRLERHLKPIADAKLEVSRMSARSQGDRIVAQMTLTTSDHTLRGQESGSNLFAATDAVTDVMDRQIQKYKGKAYRSSQAKKSARTDAAREDAALMAIDSEEELQEGDQLDSGKVLRIKRFPMKPMTVEDAIMEMELLSHSFFLFYNRETKEYNVVYRRQAGDYSVIEPELV